jgi:hypothetical protein
MRIQWPYRRLAHPSAHHPRIRQIRRLPALEYGSTQNPLSLGWRVNEFYQKGCQEKSSASTGVEVFSRDPAHGNKRDTTFRIVFIVCSRRGQSVALLFRLGSRVTVRATPTPYFIVHGLSPYPIGIDDSLRGQVFAAPFKYVCQCLAISLFE